MPRVTDYRFVWHDLLQRMRIGRWPQSFDGHWVRLSLDGSLAPRFADCMVWHAQAPHATVSPLRANTSRLLR